MQTLHIGALLEKTCYAFPIASSVLIDELFELLVFLRGPPSFPNGLSILCLVAVDAFHLGDDISN